MISDRRGSAVCGPAGASQGRLAGGIENGPEVALPQPRFLQARKLNKGQLSCAPPGVRCNQEAHWSWSAQNGECAVEGAASWRVSLTALRGGSRCSAARRGGDQAGRGRAGWDTAVLVGRGAQPPCLPRSYAFPGRLVGLSALKANAAAAPPSSSATM